MIEERKRESKKRMDEMVDRMKRVDSTLSYKSSNIVDIVQKQIEFYLGDVNMNRDTYLRRMMKQHKKGYIEMGEITKFNKIRDIYNRYNVDKFDDKMNIMRQAVNKSTMLRMCKEKKRVKRTIPYDDSILKDASYIDDVNSRSIYIEHIPSFINRYMIADIFSKYGNILYVSLPHHDNINRGYAFIEFDSIQSVHDSISLNNSIPKQFMIDNNNEYISPMRVITKIEWMRLKEEYKKIKNSMMASSIDQSVDRSTLNSGTLIRLDNIDNSTISKEDIKISILHISNVSYIDYNNSNTYCIVRFMHKIDRDTFISHCIDNCKYMIKNSMCSVSVLDSNDESAYFDMIHKKRQSYKHIK